MFDFKVNLYGDIEVSVIAENRDEAERILNETMNSISFKDIKEKISPNKDVEIKESDVKVLSKHITEKEREATR